MWVCLIGEYKSKYEERKQGILPFYKLLSLSLVNCCGRNSELFLSSYPLYGLNKYILMNIITPNTQKVRLEMHKNKSNNTLHDSDWS